MITKKHTLDEVTIGNKLFRNANATVTELLRGILRLVLVMVKILMKLVHNQFLIMDKFEIKKTPPKRKDIKIDNNKEGEKNDK